MRDQNWTLPLPSHSTFFQLFLQPLVCLKLFMFLLSDVAIAWDGHIHHHCCPLMFIHYHYVRLVIHHQLIGLDLEVPHDLNLLVLNHLWRCLLSWPWGLESILGTDVPVYDTCSLVVVFHVCFACQDLTPCCVVLYCVLSVCCGRPCPTCTWGP